MGGLRHTLLNDLGAIRRAPDEATTELLDRGRLDEDAQGFVPISLLDIQPADAVDVEDHAVTRSDTAVDLGAKRTVVAPRVDLFVLEEVATLDAGLKLLGREEVILHTMLLLPTGWTARSRDGEAEMQLGVLSEQTIDERTLPRTRWGGDDD